MKSLLSLIKNTLYILTVIIAGICLFTSYNTFTINKSILNSEFHKELFEKHNIYGNAYALINNSMANIIENIKSDQLDVYNQNIGTISLLEKSLTKDMVKLNIDNLCDGIYLYLKGERIFLPDILLGSNNMSESRNNNQSEVNSTLSTQMLNKIDKINLSAVLMYLNRNDITDGISSLKFIYYITTKLPGILLIVAMIFLFFSIPLKRKLASILKWLAYSFFIAGTLSMSYGIFLFILSKLVISHKLYAFGTLISLDNPVLYSYFYDCINHISKLSFIFAIASIIVSIGMFSIPKYFPNIFKNAPSLPDINNNFNLKLKILKYSMFAIVLSSLSSIMLTNLSQVKHDFEINDFKSALARLTNSNTATQVIAAKNDTIYTFQLKLVDSKTQEPVESTLINIVGSSNLTGKEFNEHVTTDETGSAKLTLDKGTFKLNFVQSNFPEEFKLPSPIYFDIKTASTTILTIKLDEKSEADRQKWGIAEIEVFDANNLPVPDLQLTLEGSASAPGSPNNLIAFTNSEGIAVFKLNQGNYNVIFNSEKFPKLYILPNPLELKVSPNEVSRYSIRLAKQK